MEFAICSLIGYLIGTFNPTFILGKLHNSDIRELGSGNAGASNAVIVFGKLRGAACALLDISKPCLAMRLCKIILPGFAYTYVFTGIACIIGHIYPFYMGFRGGKGLACLGGFILCFDWRVFFIMLAIEAVVVLVTDYVCFAPITAAIAFPIVYFIMTGDHVSALWMLPATVIIMIKHIENIRRIQKGVELRFSFLWKGEAETERIKANIGCDDE